MSITSANIEKHTALGYAERRPDVVGRTRTATRWAAGYAREANGLDPQNEE